jgi:hypothetical protein
MWQILRAEFAYSRVNYLLFLVFIPMLLIFGLYGSYSPPLYVAWLFTFLMVNGWNASRIKEKREMQLAQLPVSNREVALVRTLMVTVPPAAIMLIYLAVHLLIRPGLSLETEASAALAPGGALPLPVRGLLTLYGLVVLVFSLAFMFRDTFLGTRFLKGGKILIVVLIGLGVAANIYAIVVFRKVSASGGEPPAFISAIRYLMENNPSTSTARTLIFLGVCLASALLSIVTFIHRRTHLE